MANLKDCPECGVLDGPTHSHASFCSRYTAPAAVPYGRDGFVRNANGRVAGFAETNAVDAALTGWLRGQRIATAPSYAAIGNGLFVRVGTGKKRRAA